MTKYEYLDHLLANYFAVPLGSSDEEGLAQLRTAMHASVDLAQGVRGDVRQALGDNSMHWREVFADFEVAHFDDEIAAREYAHELLARLL